MVFKFIEKIFFKNDKQMVSERLATEEKEQSEKLKKAVDKLSDKNIKNEDGFDLVTMMQDYMLKERIERDIDVVTLNEKKYFQIQIIKGDISWMENSTFYDGWLYEDDLDLLRCLIDVNTGEYIYYPNK